MELKNICSEINSIACPRHRIQSQATVKGDKIIIHACCSFFELKLRAVIGNEMLKTATEHDKLQWTKMSNEKPPKPVRPEQKPISDQRLLSYLNSRCRKDLHDTKNLLLKVFKLTHPHLFDLPLNLDSQQLHLIPEAYSRFLKQLHTAPNDGQPLDIIFTLNPTPEQCPPVNW